MTNKMMNSPGRRISIDTNIFISDKEMCFITLEFSGCGHHLS